MKIKEAYRALAGEFRAQGLETPELDVRVLLAAATGLDGAQILISDHVLTQAQARQVEAWRVRRLAHEPVARILGRRAFWTLELQLSPATLDPRPDSETLIEAALELLGARRHGALHIADLGTGSGALLLALLSECPNAQGVGIDVSFQAAQMAWQNAALCHLGTRAHFMCGNWLAALKTKFDLILANPPYIASAACERLPDNVRLYDPRLALDGGPDGHKAYRAIARQAQDYLDDEGFLILEIGSSQAQAVVEIFEEAGYGPIQKRCDLSGHIRALSFRKNPVKNLMKNPLEKRANTAMNVSMS